MYWFPYLSLAINLIIIWFMPKRLTNKEIYVSWAVIALINLSTDVMLSLYFRLYELNGGGVQLWVHIIELTLGASFGIIFLNFMPESRRSFFFYTAAWVIFSVLLRNGYSSAGFYQLYLLEMVVFCLLLFCCFFICPLAFALYQVKLELPAVAGSS